MKNIIVTGGAGFIGRWIVKDLLSKNYNVYVIDNLSNGQQKNIKEFKKDENFKFLKGDITSTEDLKTIFSESIDLCIHAAAQINVHESLQYPDRSFETNVLGTYKVLEHCRKGNIKLSLLGTCMVYDLASTDSSINELHPTKPASTYAGSKLAAEDLALSYYLGLGLPITILRPFNTYGPYQKINMEGGVVSIFINNQLSGETIKIFGDGNQTRDLLYVEDCADFIVRASLSEKTNGEIINAGTGNDISINDLAKIICSDISKITHIPHHHPQSEIKKLKCDFSKAKSLLGWEPKTNLQSGIEKTRDWIKNEG